MSSEQPNNPLHGVTLEAMLKHLVREIGWDGMARRVEIRCFMFEPTITSSLRFLRRTPWARQKVEETYLDNLPPARAPKVPT